MRTTTHLAVLATLTISLSSLIGCGKDDTKPEIKADVAAAPAAKSDDGSAIAKGDSAKAIGADPQKLYKEFCSNDPGASLQKGLSRLFMRFMRDGNTVIVDACGKDNNGIPNIVQVDVVNVGNYKDAYIKASTCRDSGSSTCYYRVPDQGHNENASISFVKWSNFTKIPPSYTDGDSWKKAPDETWLIIAQLVDNLPSGTTVAHNPQPKGNVVPALYVVPVTPPTQPPATTATLTTTAPSEYVTKKELAEALDAQKKRDEGQDTKIKETGDKVATLQSAFDEWALHHKTQAGK